MPRAVRSEVLYESLLGQIYDAALLPCGWAAAVAGVAAALGGRSGALLFQDRTPALPVTDVTAMVGYPDDALATYQDQFAAADTRIAAVLAQPPGHVMADEWQFDYAAYLRMPIYNEFYRPLGVSRGIGVRLFSDGRRAGLLSVFREPGRGSYTADDLRLMGRLSPHVIRALHLKRQLDRAEAVGHGLASGLDRFPQAVLLLDMEGQMLGMNAAADELLSVPGCPLCLRGGRLSAEGLADDAALQQTVHDASSAGAGRPPDILRLRPRGGAGPIALMLVPARRADRLGLGQANGLLVFVAGPQPLPADPFLLAHQYGFSPVEAHVAASLLAGERVADIADRRQVSRATVQTQVKAVLSKTGTRSQGRLVALLSRGLGVLRS